jgi:hypothetical protein
LRLDLGLNGGYSRRVLIITYSLLFVQGAVIGPIVEEYLWWLLKWFSREIG